MNSKSVKNINIGLSRDGVQYINDSPVSIASLDTFGLVNRN